MFKNYVPNNTNWDGWSTIYFSVDKQDWSKNMNKQIRILTNSPKQQKMKGTERHRQNPWAVNVKHRKGAFGQTLDIKNCQNKLKGKWMMIAYDEFFVSELPFFKWEDVWDNSNDGAHAQSGWGIITVWSSWQNLMSPSSYSNGWPIISTWWKPQSGRAKLVPAIPFIQ